MALHSLKELHDKTADQIRELIKSGCKIDTNVQIHKQNVFYAKLVKEDYIVPGLKHELIITTSESSDMFTKLFIVNSNVLDDTIHRRKCWHYFKVNDDIYADTEDEAKEERKKLLDINIGKRDTCDKDRSNMFSDIFSNLEFM